MNFLEAALAYQKLGLHPVPCEPRGKRSLISWKEYQERRPTVEEITYWWTQYPDANIALVLGRGLMAVDIDSFEGRENLAAAGVVLPADAPIVATGKGAHIYLAGTSGDRVGLVPGVDIRGVGYVVAPPSVHPSGRVYTWVNPISGGIPAAPPSLLALLGSKGAEVASASAGDWFSNALIGVAEGGRDSTCTRLAGYLLGKGLPQGAVSVILQSWAERCSPPFPPDQVEKCVESIAKREAFDAPGTLPPSADDLMEATLALITSPVRNVRSTGLQGLDKLLEGGFEPGTFTLIGGTAGTGKTAIMLQMAYNIAAAGAGVLIVSLEMGATRLLRRMLSQVSQVKFNHLKTGDLVEGERIALGMAADKLRGVPLWIETRIRTVEAVDAILAEYDPGSIGAIFIDYAQKMSSPYGGEDRRSEVEHVSEAITKLAIHRNIPVIAASALSRPDVSRAGWRPTINSLRESAKLGHDADNVILLYRDQGADLTEVDVAKQRDGATGGTVLFFHGHNLTFSETA